ncbi:MAG: hypothetical protein ACRDLK_04345 [Gaiellaceae bacterium]
MAAFVDELEFAFGWIAPEPNFMRRCSHAVAAGGRVWLIDPVWDEEALERAAGLGDPAGVVQQLDRHNRDCARVAERLGVPLHVVPFEPPADAPFQTIRLLRNRFWREVALWFPETKTLSVAEALGTAQFYRAPQERLAVSPVLRLTPPRRLLGVEPEHVLVGHGSGIHEDATAAVREAVAGSRRNAPAWLWAGFRAHRPFGHRGG